MTSILEELFYGNVCPGTDFRSKDTKTRKLMAHLANHHEALSGTLTDKQKELLEVLITRWLGVRILLKRTPPKPIPANELISYCPTSKLCF